MKKLSVAIIFIAIGFSWTASAQEGVNPWLLFLDGLKRDPVQVKEIRTLIKRPRRLRCAKLETYQTYSLVRWVQNSGLFPYPSFQIIRDRLPFYEYDPDEVTRLLGEEGEDQDTDQLDDQTNLDGSTQAIYSPDEEAELQESTVEMFASPVTLNFIDELTARVYEKIRTRMTITALTTSPLHKNDVHCSHMTGYAFDVRPLPGIQARTFWWIKNKKVYDVKMNQALILDLLKQP
ncbi:MAG: hypothetical protein ABL958_15165, partial [Bdellovibrionia bacterium]